MAQEDDGRCRGGTSSPGSQTGPATGACALPTDKKFVVCPPSNGVTADYYLDALTAGYVTNMTTQSPECRKNSNVIQVGAESPYCDGGQVSGPGGGPPTLVACMVGNLAQFVDVHGGPNFEVLAANIPIDEIEKRFPGQRYMIVRQERCTPLPDFGVSAPAPAPTPAPTPTPTPTPTPPPIQAPKPTPPSLPTQPIGGGIMPMPVQPMPMAQPMARQVPMAPKAAAPTPPPPPPAPKPAAKCPPSPAKGNEWWNYCLTNEKVYPVYVEPTTTLETALGIGAVAAAAALAIFAFK
jgi:hypothetical protein